MQVWYSEELIRVSGGRESTVVCHGYLATIAEEVKVENTVTSLPLRSPLPPSFVYIFFPSTGKIFCMS